jgi:hypothetical protein
MLVLPFWNFCTSWNFHPPSASHHDLPSWNCFNPELLSWKFLSSWNCFNILNFHPGNSSHPGTRLAPLIKTTRLAHSTRRAFFPRNYHLLLILVVGTTSHCTLSTVCVCVQQPLLSDR